jgi:signal recognition particle subunit SEC65
MEEKKGRGRPKKTAIEEPAAKQIETAVIKTAKPGTFGKHPPKWGK